MTSESATPMESTKNLPKQQNQNQNGIVSSTIPSNDKQIVSKKTSEITPHFLYTGGTNGQTSNNATEHNHDNGDLLPHINSSDSQFQNNQTFDKLPHKSIDHNTLKAK